MPGWIFACGGVGLGTGSPGLPKKNVSCQPGGDWNAGIRGGRSARFLGVVRIDLIFRNLAFLWGQNPHGCLTVIPQEPETWAPSS